MDEDRSKPTRLTGEEARQGHIVLRSRRRRIIFIGGLVAFVLFSLAAGLLWRL